jgi:threonyl-tRNA synthetase
MDNEQLSAMRHSLAHITAQAAQHLWPEAKFGVGPVVENGFYYDIDVPGMTISEEDFPKIEAEMRRVIEANYPFERSEKSVDDGIKWAEDANQPYKVELLNDLKRAGTTIAKDLDASEMGTIAEGDSAIENVSFYTAAIHFIFIGMIKYSNTCISGYKVANARNIDILI